MFDYLLQFALKRLDGFFGHRVAPEDVVELEGHGA